MFAITFARYPLRVKEEKRKERKEDIERKYFGDLKEKRESIDTAGTTIIARGYYLP